MKTIYLPEAGKLQLREATLNLKFAEEYIEDFLLSLYPVFAHLPKELLKAVFDFSRNPESPGAVLLRNFPIDDALPVTPIDGGPAENKTTFISEASALGVAQMIGEPVGYRLEKGGNIVHNICPVPGSVDTQSNEGSREFLRFHNDTNYDADSPQIPCNVNNPDFFLLVCLRQDRNGEAKTAYVDARDRRDICARLTRDEIEILRQPQFSFAVPYSFRKENEIPRLWSVPVPIIKGPAQYPEITIDFGSGTKALQSEFTTLLDKLDRICNDPELVRAVALKPGDLLLINNRKGVHARTSFKPIFDGNDRWLQRVYVRKNLWKLRNEGGFSRIF